ncbi:hypothetical protein GCM10007978_01600 [Shewanella hanedai]|uniref:Uncharacterized protein n=1 Tax=Shewanella hanedai TaxID=25 RepID=A0A553JUY9_SHEHA|nr:hypothetical protein [Shewanella hanedai]TRY16272.1 hypothetical protein FN961_01190 [Shewanella hanedai]GGI67615.1 hypothetical protein GCM10007978_01600 [Shewanella hanedai]
MIEFEPVNQTLKFPEKPTGESKDNNQFFITRLNTKPSSQDILDKSSIDRKAVVDVLPDNGPLTTELLEQWQDSTDIASSMLPYALYGGQQGDVKPGLGGTNDGVKQTPVWLAVGSYQIQTFNAVNTANEVIYKFGNDISGHSTSDTVSHYKNVWSEFHSGKFNGVLTTNLQSLGVNGVTNNQSKNHKAIEVSGINSSFWKALELTSVRRFTVAEHLGVRTARVRDYFSADVNIEYTEVFESLNIDRLIINGNLHRERK